MLESDKRKTRRYPSIARVQIPEVFSGSALLKDISITGCRIECTMHVDIKEQTAYTITLHPEVAAKIHSFDLTVECKWFRPGHYSCDIGFEIKKSPKGKDFQRYVDYLSWRQER
ncbi:MAG: PilZ domain-containing protein [Spirochaetaceae bacterium]|jgi:hypothetical protein|nr:PilZ domain-containing protein [Spirochaetaceae bacterium]